jgi:hypothetical protein
VLCLIYVPLLKAGISVRRYGLALSIGPNWLDFTWRRRQNPVSETLCFEKWTRLFLDKDKKMDNVQKQNICIFIFSVSRRDCKRNPLSKAQETTVGRDAKAEKAHPSYIHTFNPLSCTYVKPALMHFLNIGYLQHQWRNILNNPSPSIISLSWLSCPPSF